MTLQNVSDLWFALMSSIATPFVFSWDDDDSDDNEDDWDSDGMDYDEEEE